MKIEQIWKEITSTEKEQRAVSLPDALYIYEVIKKYKPKVVLEIGTWIGTVTRIITEAMDGKVYTCDKKHVFNKAVIKPPDRDRVKYYNCKSTKLLKKLSKKGIKIDFCFVDACLQRGDNKLIKSLFRDRVVFATHDYKLPGDKGVRNVELMYKVCNPAERFIIFIGPPENSSVAIIEEK
jgi:hypothetical protein